MLDNNKSAPAKMFIDNITDSGANSVHHAHFHTMKTKYALETYSNVSQLTFSLDISIRSANVDRWVQRHSTYLYCDFSYCLISSQPFSDQYPSVDLNTQQTHVHMYRYSDDNKRKCDITKAILVLYNLMLSVLSTNFLCSTSQLVSLA